MSLNVLVSIGSGDRRLPDVVDDFIMDYNTLLEYGKKKIYDTRSHKVMKFSSLYKSVFPNDVVLVNDKILGNKKGIVKSHTISITNGIVKSDFEVICDYE